MKYLVIVMCILLLAFTANADHDLDIYAFDDVFVFDKFARGGRLIKFVSLVDSTDLQVASEVQTSANFPLSAYGHHEKMLLVTFHNRIEIYNVANLKSPELVQTVSLREGNLPRFRWPKIAHVDDRYFVVSRRAVAELILPAENTLGRVDVSTDIPAIEEEDWMNEKFPPFNYSRRFSWPFVVRETNQFRYDVGWEIDAWIKGSRGGSSRKLRKYLRKIRIADQVVVSRLLLGESLETAD